MANITKAELQAKYDALVEERATEHRKIIEIAGAAAQTHDLCNVLDETLEAVGIPIPTIEVVVESATVYRIPMTVAYRIGLLDKENDLKEIVSDATQFGVLSEDYDDADYRIRGGLDKDDPIIANVTMRELPAKKEKKPKPVAQFDDIGPLVEWEKELLGTTNSLAA